MSPRTGRPKSNNPKDIQLKIRADKKTIEDLNYCCEKTNLNRSEVIRLGIKKVKQEVEEKNNGNATPCKVKHYHYEPTDCSI